MASECDICWTLVGQAAQGVRDSNLHSLVRSCEGETTGQIRWLRSRMSRWLLRRWALGGMSTNSSDTAAIQSATRVGSAHRHAPAPRLPGARGGDTPRQRSPAEMARARERTRRRRHRAGLRRSPPAACLGIRLPRPRRRRRHGDGPARRHLAGDRSYHRSRRTRRPQPRPRPVSPRGRHGPALCAPQLAAAAPTAFPFVCVLGALAGRASGLPAGRNSTADRSGARTAAVLGLALCALGASAALALLLEDARHGFVLPLGRAARGEDSLTDGLVSQLHDSPAARSGR